MRLLKSGRILVRRTAPSGHTTHTRMHTHFFGARGSFAPSARSIFAMTWLWGIALPDCTADHPLHVELRRELLLRQTLGGPRLRYRQLQLLDTVACLSSSVCSSRCADSGRRVDRSAA